MARLDERVARSPVGSGWIERSHFADACASLWIDGELVYLKDLVMHDAGHDIRTPTHELTIARDVLRSRRRIASQAPGWALGVDGVRSLRRVGAESGVAAAPAPAMPAVASPSGGSASAGEGEAGESSQEDALTAEFAAIDAAIARSEAANTGMRSTGGSGDREKDAGPHFLHESAQEVSAKVFFGNGLRFHAED